MGAGDSGTVMGMEKEGKRRVVLQKTGKNADVHCTIIPNAQKVETTKCPSKDEWIDLSTKHCSCIRGMKILGSQQNGLVQSGKMLSWSLRSK